MEINLFGDERRTGRVHLEEGLGLFSSRDIKQALIFLIYDLSLSVPVLTLAH